MVFGFNLGDFASDGLGFVADPADVFGGRKGKKAAQVQQEAAANALAAQQAEAQAARDQFQANAQLGIGAIQQGTTEGVGAINASTDASTGAIDRGTNQGIGALLGGAHDASRAITGSENDALNTLQSGSSAAGQALGSGFARAQGQLARGTSAARSDLDPVLGLQRFADSATNAVSTFDALGRQPGRVDAAAAQDPLAGFEQSAGYKFRQQQGEEAINRANAARGGRAGGRALKELSQFNQGLASQEFDAFANRRLAQRGQTLGALSGADAREAALLQNQAGRTDQAALAAQGAQLGLAARGFDAQGALSNLSATHGQIGAGLSAQQGQGLAGLRERLAGQSASVQETAGQNQSNIATTLGQNQSNLFANQGQSLASIYGAQGTNLANLYSDQGSNIANALTGVSANSSQLSQALIPQYNNQVGLAGADIVAQQNADAERNKTAASIFGAFSDERLKDNIQTIEGSVYERLGLRGVSWTWNNEANRLGLVGNSAGVVAQEVAQKYPEAVTEQAGYLAVRYDILSAKLLEQARA